MTELLTAAQMRAIEQAAIASGAVTGLELMERAGRGVVEAVFAEWPELAAGSFRAVVLCGPGGNGGDGFVVARLLKEWGWEVEVFLYGAPERMPPDARVNYERWLGMGEVIGSDRNTQFLPPGVYPYRYALMVDALFGIGLSQPVWPNLADYFGTLADSGMVGSLRKVSVDIPSGICADSGRVIGAAAFPADLTVTFHRSNIGHILSSGPEASGRLAVWNIGLPRHVAPRSDGPSIKVFVSEVSDPMGLLFGNSLNKEAFNRRGRDQGTHKYSYGHALILSGPPSHGGAARLAARGALRIGAGVVTVGCEAAALAEHAARLDAVMLREVAGAAGLAEVLADVRINALCLGPGLGLDARGAGLVAAAMRAVRGEHAPYLVLDADALTILAGDAGLFGQLNDRCVLTPHAGEFARLFPDIAGRLAEPAVTGPAYSKVDACREAAARAGCVVLFKGADTVIAAPDGRCAINAAVYDRAAPWLATAGSGDVLAGFIAGLLARGFQPFDAACTAAWLHVECARSFGPGLIAEDLPEELPKVFRGLGL